MVKLTTTQMTEVLEAYSHYLRFERMLSPKTCRHYLRELTAFEGFAAEHAPGVPLEDVGKRDISRFLSSQSAVGERPSPGAWNLSLSALRSFYDYLYKEDKVEKNPARKVDRKRIHPKSRMPLTLSEMLRLVDTVFEHSKPQERRRNVALVQVLFHCAVRVSELVSLDVEQVDFDNYRLLNVRTKGGKPLGVMFNDVVAEALRDYLDDCHRRPDAHGGDALFTSRLSRRMSVRTVEDMVKRMGAHARLSRPLTPHLLRHSSVTVLVGLNTPVPVVQSHVGHESISTTQRYVHISGEQQQGAINTLGREWRKQRSKQSKSAAA